MAKVILIALLSLLKSQEIDWDKKPGQITAIEIFCDTEGIPIFIDGIQIGVSPIKDPVQVAPGWHQISYFPPQLSIDTGSVKQNKIMRDMINLARQDILVEEGSTVRAEEGSTVRAVLSYRTIESQALEYQKKISSSRWLGFGMIFLIVSFMIWGIM